MYTLDRSAWEVLNATADDWENLEQIQQLACFDFAMVDQSSQEEVPRLLRPRQGAPLLEEIADRICDLVKAGLLEGRLGEDGQPLLDLNDRSYVWRAWFQMTPKGRLAWDTSEWATLTEQEQH